MVVKEIDITKLKPFNWKWLVGFLIAIIVAIGVYGVAQWVVAKAKTAIPTKKIEEETI